MTDPITNEEAALIAEQWHSVITWSGLSVAMYSVTSTGRVHNETHREQLLKYIELQMDTARHLDDTGDPPVLTRYATNVEELEALRAWATQFKVS